MSLNKRNRVEIGLKIIFQTIIACHAEIAQFIDVISFPFLWMLI